MITLCIRYTIDPKKLNDFEEYARRIPEAIARCGGKPIGYYLPTNFAGPTDSALALIDFPSLAAYEKYREALAKDADATANVAAAQAAACIVAENRSFLRKV